MTAANVHGTAIVLGTTGLLFVGPSGSGKSTAALHCLQSAECAGVFSALISDDQVLISQAGPHVIGRGPASIKGLIEIRGSGIVRVPTIDAAILQRAVMPITPPFSERMPPENETWIGPGNARLPLFRLHFAENGSTFDLLKTVLPEMRTI